LGFFPLNTIKIIKEYRTTTKKNNKLEKSLIVDQAVKTLEMPAV